MGIGVFTDRGIQPEQADIQKTIGIRFDLWELLLTHIRSTYSPKEDIKFLYGKNYGWAYRFQVKGRLLTALYPTNGGFTVQIILNPDGVEITRSISTGQNVQKAIEDANPYPEGRWLFIPVESPADLEDIYRLLELKTAKN